VTALCQFVRTVVKTSESILTLLVYSFFFPGTLAEESSNQSWDTATPAPGLGMPQHQSTAVKRRRMDEESASEQGSEADFTESS
jgi:hypothetical protein